MPVLRWLTAALALAAMVLVDVLRLPMSVAVGMLLGAVVQRYLLAPLDPRQGPEERHDDAAKGGGDDG